MSSVNQSHYRRSGGGRSGNSRNFSGGGRGGGGSGGGGGGGGSTTGHPSSAYYSGKSYKKVVNNAQGAHIQPPLRGTPDGSSTAGVVKPTDVPVQKSTPGLPKAPQSNAGSLGLGTTGPSTPVKGLADASNAFPLQFGSISPGVIGMQVPARTSSAPPNLDEQKRAQARLDSLKAASIQNQAVPKPNLPRKDPGPVDQPSETRPVSKEKKDVHSSPPGPVAAHTQKPTGPPIPSIHPGVSMQMPFHQPQIHLPYGGSNPPLQHQNIPNPSLQVPLHMPPQVPPQVFVPGIQHHQGFNYQSQGLPFLSQMGPQLGPQYQQQHPPMSNLNFGGARRSVKITHPDTHEELRLDKNGGSSGQRSNPPQSQAFPPAAHPMNFYPNSYNAGPPFPMPPGSNSLANSQTAPASQPPRFYSPASKPVTIKQPVITSHAEKAGGSMNKVEISNKSQTEGRPNKDLETLAVKSGSLTNTSHAEKAGGSMNKVEISNKSQTEGQPNKDLETLAVKSDSLTNTSSAAIEAGVAKAATVKKSGSFKEEQKQPPEKIDVTETSSKVEGPPDVVDLSASKCDNDEESLNSAQVICNTPKVDVVVPIAEIKGSKEQVKESVEKSQVATVPDVNVAPLVEHVNDVDDKALGSDSAAANVDALSAEISSLNLGSSHGDNKEDTTSKVDVDQVNSRESVSVSVPEASPLTLDAETTDLVSPSSSSNIAKGVTAAKGKKKLKEIMKNADARGNTSDLYNAYKSHEEKTETSSAAEVVENPNTFVSPASKITTVLSSDERSGGPTKFELEDWEDAADISAPKMDTGLKLKHHSEVDNDGMTKKYSRDFLLKFADHFTDLPEGFEIVQDISEVLVGVNMPREPYPSPGRGGGDRSVAGSRLDRRPSNVGLDDRWNKVSGGPMGPVWDPRSEMGYPARGNHGVLRTPRGQPPGQYVQYAGGILSGLMQSPVPQMQRNNSDSDRWQRATGYQKGLMPSPHAPMIHKAEKKYEIGKVTDEEQAKQRRLKSILNKLTPQNFDKLFDQVKQVNIDNADTLSGVIGQIFDKALMEPTFVEMYANFCSCLAAELPGFGDDHEKITFKRLLLNKCQEEFERGEREEEEANRTEEEGEVKQTEEEREEKRVKARRRMLGNIRLIGELYKKRMLTERIMHECIKKLLGFNQKNPIPDEEDIEALCKLLSTIGEMIDHPKAKEHMDIYFNMMFQLSNNMALSSRVRFMLKDTIDLRKNKWQQRRKVEGPKKIEEVHWDAIQERQAQSSRVARGPNSNPSFRRGGQPMDFGPKGSAGVLSSNPQMGGGYRALPQQQVRGYGGHDSRFDSFESRTLSVPLRPMGDEAITLGPQGGLARGMSVRGQAGPSNSYGVPSRDDLASRFMPERFSPHPPSIQEHTSLNYGSHDSRITGRAVFDRAPPPERARVSTPPKSDSSDKILSEDHLHDKSIQTIKEFYSARDEKEVALCMKDLNAPGFYPSMISIWVTDSFERKDTDRDLLTKLLINLNKSHEGILSQDSLIRGLESVLSTLEDTVNDAPKAAEFLGRMLAGILLENVIPYKEVWRIIYEGGEERGRLVKIGLAAEVVGVILETIKSEKGDPFLNEMRAASNLRVEDFRSSKASRLDKFI
ncbi:eukaryotic translation initiation factor 4G-like [Bidens hawaiensis]|uniref:eukaryotic translation initiation factor 4G-like n=1 Tax=Bidens hawaiensis TaxID=980011 RepID=UPI004048FB40